MNLPLVSVIVPVYNVEDLLPRCVDSILAQGHRNLEVILVDDGSTDRSAAICDDFSARDQRVRVVHQGNAGLSGARNRGLDEATGTWLCFVDSDDWLAPSFVERLLDAAQACAAQVAVGSFRRRSDDRPSGPHPRARERILTTREVLLELEGPAQIRFVVAWGKLYRRELLANVRFPVGRVHEDDATTHMIYLAAERVVDVDEPLYQYWQRPDSIMGAAPSPGRVLDAIMAVRQRMTDLRDAGHLEAAALTRLKLSRLLIKLVRISTPDDPETRAWALSQLRSVVDGLPPSVSWRHWLFVQAYARWPRWVDRVYSIRTSL